MIRTLLVVFLALAAATAGFGQTEKPLLLQQPTVSRTQVAFVYAGDLWIVGRQGGDARRLTTGPGNESGPIFSPDGNQIAFTGEYDGNQDVYVVPAAGGVPRRLTYHPGPDWAAGWTPDGKRVLLGSFRNSYSRFARLFTMPLDGVFPTEVPLPMAWEGSYSADGSRLAYVPVSHAFTAWKRYRGGMTASIWLANLADSRVEKIPRQNSNDFEPMWVGEKVYFLSDRSGPVTLYAYDTSSKKVTQVLRNDGLDLKSASAGPGAIVYEQFGSLHLFDPASGKAQRLEIRVAGDLPSVRPRYVKVANRIAAAQLSPKGARAVFEARGEIFTVPAEKGDVRDLTNTPGVAERDPAWSPDGKWIAYFSDESGEYALHLREQNGMGEVRKISLGDPPSFYYSPTWSPDSKKIAYMDKRLNLWYVDLEKKTPTRVDTDTYERPWRTFNPVWSPDSRWLAYAKQLKNHLGAIFVHELATGKSDQLTDGMSDAQYPAFDRNGKYLYFTASTNAGPTIGWIEMSTYNRPVTRSAYVMVLRKDLPSPLAPESDEEKVEGSGRDGSEAGRTADEKSADKESGKSGDTAPGAEKAAEKEPVVVRIDREKIGQRILALPIPARNYTGMVAGKSGVLFLLESAPVPGFGFDDQLVHRFDLEKRKTEKLLEGVGGFAVSANGEKLLYQQGERWVIAATSAPPKAGEGTLKLDGMEVGVDPRAEWRQIYHEVWRIERDFFYDPGFHGLDLKATEAKYAPYLESLASREDLNTLFREALGELSVGHLYVDGGDRPEVKPVPGGLLGADYRIENGRYRFARVYDGENWNPQLQAPLTQPGVNVVAGEYLLAVNGRELRATDNLYRLFEATAGKSVVLRVGTDPNGAGAREVTVVPVGDETALRNRAWIEDNRRKVDELTGGRVAYVYLPNTAGGGYGNFNRYYYAQVQKEGAVLDERFNGGGSLADYIIDAMRRPLMSYFTTREGEDVPAPAGAIFGPKAMIINEYAGSGGDWLPWSFRRAGLGPLVGTRTWGGLVGIYGYPQLIDGGGVTAPRVAIYNPSGEYDIENRGVAPDVEVELDPQAWRAGRDPQLEKAVALVMEALQKNPLTAHKKPPYPNYHPGARRTTAVPPAAPR